ncbi:MAG: hypothetical protein H0T76_07570 [Nannocystis sp.]|nr:fibrinogen-like YCDxxxxGGGW domain-containing protein [Nannocystis sp.]MBA3546323.1 hypothetical protein [Nannocystis sp.]
MPRMPRPVLVVLLLTSCVGEVVEGTSGAVTEAGSGPGTSTGKPDEPGTSTGMTGMTSMTGEPTTGEPTTSAGTDSATTQTSGAGICGDGTLDPGEACDDGDLDDTDDCTSKCAASSCTDGLKGGLETDVDCGGACPKCGGGDGCIVDGDCLANSCDAGVCAPVAVSCLELLTKMPGLPNESYNIDPEGDGSLLLVYCDMQGGGWTQVARETGGELVDWSAGTIASCGAFGELLGGAGQFGSNATTEKSFMLLNVPHSEARVVAEVVIMDSWDTEKIVVEVDGQQVASRVCRFDDPNSCNQQQNQCGSGTWKDGQIELVGQRAHAGDSTIVKLRTDLSEDANNESWGLGALTLFVK